MVQKAIKFKGQSGQIKLKVKRLTLRLALVCFWESSVQRRRLPGARTYHSFYFFIDSIHRGTLAGVAIAEAVSSNHHIVNRVIILFSDFHSGIQKVISQSM